MRNSAKISISLPSRLLRQADQERRRSDETRSEFFRRAVETLLFAERREGALRRYLAGYAELPESPGEIAWISEASADALAEEPWE